MSRESANHPRECIDTNPSEEIGFVSYLQMGGQPDPQGWVCSTGATLHVCNSRDKFDDYRPVSRKHVLSISGDKVDVAGIGSVTLKFTSGKKVTLTDVAHAPSSVTNFLSVGRFDCQGFEVTFDYRGGKAMYYNLIKLDASSKFELLIVKRLRA